MKSLIKQKKFLFGVLFVVLCAMLFPISALCEEQEPNYLIEGGALISWEDRSDAKTLTIPSTLYGQTIISLGKESTEGDHMGSYSIIGDSFHSVTHLTIGEGIQEVWTDGAFRKLQYVKLPSTITRIGYSSFEHLEDLETVVLPSTNISFDPYVFHYCEKLQNINLGNTQSTEISYGMFKRCTSLKNITLPTTLKEVGWHAFLGCTSLTSITIPDNCIIIGGHAFRDCTSLHSVTLPPQTQHIEYNAFDGCTSLTEIEIPDGCYYIADSAFANCTSLYNVELPSNLQDVNVDTFNGCTSLNEIEIPEGCNSIGSGAFANCTNLETATFLSKDTKITAEAFPNCPNLTIRCYKGSKADEYAQDHNIPVEYIGGSGTIELSADVDNEKQELEALEWACGNFMLPESADPNQYCLNVDVSITRTSNLGETEYIPYRIVLPDGFSFDQDTIKPEDDFEAYFDVENFDEEYTQPIPVYMTYTSSMPEIAEFKLYLNPDDSNTDGEEPEPECNLEVPVSKRTDAGKILCPGTNGLSSKSFFDVSPEVDWENLMKGSPSQFNNGIMELTSAFSFSVYNELLIKESLNNLGFTRVEYNGNAGTSGVASTFASKKMVVDNDIKDLVLVIVRGTSGFEWVGNFLIEGDAPEHEDFNNVKNDVLKNLKDWMEDFDIDSTACYGLVCGHSRGAAVANLLTHDLNTNNRSLFNKVAGYTYATPNAIKDGNEQADSNLFNIVYRHDAVGYVPPDYAKHGITYALGRDKDNIPANVSQRYKTFTGKNYTAPNQPLVISMLLNSYHYANSAVTYHNKIGKLLVGNKVPEMDFAVAHSAENYLAWIYGTGNSSFAKMETVEKEMGGWYENVMGRGVSLVADVLSAASLSKKITTDVLQALHITMVRFNILDVSSFYMLYVDCPVDVTVYDNTGTAIAVIQDHEVVSYNSEKLEAVCYEETDCILIPANIHHKVEITGNDSGTMDIGIARVEIEGNNVKYDDTKTFTNVSVAAGQEFNLSFGTTGSASSMGLVVVDPSVKQTIALPAALKNIKDEAFVGSASTIIIVPETIESIGERAFADSTQLEILKILSMDVSLPEDIVENSPKAVIHCYEGSQAEYDAEEYDLQYTYLGE